MEKTAPAAMVNQPTAPQAQASPLVPTHVALQPQDMLDPTQGPYGSRPGEQRLDSQGNVVTGFAGIKRTGK